MDKINSEERLEEKSDGKLSWELRKIYPHKEEARGRGVKDNIQAWFPKNEEIV